MHQSNMLYTLNLYNVTCPMYLIKKIPHNVSGALFYDPVMALRWWPASESKRLFPLAEWLDS